MAIPVGLPLTVIIHIFSYIARFILVLIYPVLQVLLLAIIDTVKKDENHVVRIGKQRVRIKHKKWRIGEKGWLMIARVGLPVAFLFIALAIVVVGMVSRWYTETG